MGRRALAGVAAALALCLVIYSGHADSSAVRHFDTMAEAAMAASQKVLSAQIACASASCKREAAGLLTAWRARQAHLAKLEEEGGTEEGEKQVDLKVEYTGQTADDVAYEADREKFSEEHPDEVHSSPRTPRRFA
jgi:hypothetical protein